MEKLLDGPKELTGVDYSKGPMGSMVHISLDKVLDRLGRVEKKLEVEQGILKQQIESKKEVKEKLKGLSRIEYKALYYRIVEGLTMEKVAEKIHRSERQTYRILKKV